MVLGARSSPENGARRDDRAFHHLAKSVGLPNLRLHDLRHTHATAMLQANVHPEIVRERLGHSSIGITIDTYTRMVPGLQEAAARRFEEWLEARLSHAPVGVVY